MKPLSEQTLYELLEVPVDASQAEIVRAWERMQAVFGPGSLATYTLMAPDEVELLGARLEEARTVLLDPDARHHYDARALSSPSPASPSSAGAVVTPAETAPALVPPSPVAEQVVAEVPEQLVLIAEAPPILLRHEVGPGTARVDLAARPSPPFAAVAPGAGVLPPPVAGATARAEPAPLAAAVPAPPARPASRPRAPGGERELVVPEGTRYTGEVLRRAREARGLTIEQVCQRTKVLRQHVENIEGDRYDRLPAPVYLRGILMAVAKELRLDGQKVARSYLDASAAAQEHGRPR